MLLKRGLYLSAVKLTKLENEKLNNNISLTKQITEKVNSNDIKLILITTLKQYAEYLIKKHRYDEAAEQLIETIDLKKDHCCRITAGEAQYALSLVNGSH